MAPQAGNQKVTLNKTYPVKWNAESVINDQNHFYIPWPAGRVWESFFCPSHRTIRPLGVFPSLSLCICFLHLPPSPLYPSCISPALLLAYLFLLIYPSAPPPTYCLSSGHSSPPSVFITLLDNPPGLQGSQDYLCLHTCMDYEHDILQNTEGSHRVISLGCLSGDFMSDTRHF